MFAAAAALAVPVQAADMKGMFAQDETEGMSGNTGSPKVLPEKTPAQLAAENAAVAKREAFFAEKAAAKKGDLFAYDETEGMSGNSGPRSRVD